MAIARLQTVLIIDPNEDCFYDDVSIPRVLDRHTDWIVLADEEQRFTFEWDDDLDMNNTACSFAMAKFELEQVAERKEE